MRGRPSQSQALAATIRAWVESSPPETPMTRCLPLVACEAPGDALHLDVERLVAILIELLGPVGDEGEAAQRPLEADVGEARLVLEGDAAEAGFGMAGGGGAVVEGAVAHPLEPEPLDVDVGDGELAARAAKRADLGEQLAQLVDRALAVPGEIGGALARAGGGEDIGRRPQRADWRAHSNSRSSALPMSDVGRRQVAEDQRAGERAEGRGRQRRPIILANLDVEDEVGEVARRRRADRCRTARSGPRPSIFEPAQADARREPALLIIFAVIGQEALRHDAEDAAARDRDARNCRAGRCGGAARRPAAPARASVLAASRPARPRSTASRKASCRNRSSTA